MTDFQFRNNSVFLSKTNHKALRLLAKAKELKCADELADEIITEWLKAHHPEAARFIEEQQKSLEAFSKSLHAALKPSRPLD